MQAIHVETSLFEFWEDDGTSADPVLPGESFARWLKSQLSDSGYEFDEPLGEDYGWGFFATHGKENFWIAVSFAGASEDQTTGCWVISADRHSGLLGFFRKKDPALLEGLRKKIAEVLESAEEIHITSKE